MTEAFNDSNATPPVNTPEPITALAIPEAKTSPFNEVVLGELGQIVGNLNFSAVTPPFYVVEDGATIGSIAQARLNNLTGKINTGLNTRELFPITPYGGKAKLNLPRTDLPELMLQMLFDRDKTQELLKANTFRHPNLQNPKIRSMVDGNDPKLNNLLDLNKKFIDLLVKVGVPLERAAREDLKELKDYEQITFHSKWPGIKVVAIFNNATDVYQGGPNFLMGVTDLYLVNDGADLTDVPIFYHDAEGTDLSGFKFGHVPEQRTSQTTVADKYAFSTTTSPDELKSLYRNWAMKLHPDVNSSSTAEEDFKEMSAAYDELKKERHWD